MRLPLSPVIYCLHHTQRKFIVQTNNNDSSSSVLEQPEPQPRYVHTVVDGMVVSQLVDSVRYTADGRILATSAADDRD